MIFAILGNTNLKMKVLFLLHSQDKDLYIYLTDSAHNNGGWGGGAALSSLDLTVSN